MSDSLTRRQIAKGAAWAAPVVTASAISPAYAGSQQYRYGDSEVSKTTITSTTVPCRTTITVSNTESSGASKPGFTIYALAGSPLTTATLYNLDYYIVLPKSWAVPSFSITSGASTWSYAGKVATTSLPLENGTTLNTTNYDVFKFTFTGTKTGYTVRTDGSETTWTGSLFTATATSTQYCPGTNRSVTTYSGYRFGYTLANGAKNYPANSLSSIKVQTFPTA